MSSSSLYIGSVTSTPRERAAKRTRDPASSSASAGVSERSGKFEAVPFGFWAEELKHVALTPTDLVVFIAGDMAFDNYPSIAEWGGVEIFTPVSDSMRALGHLVIERLRALRAEGKEIKRIISILPRLPSFNTMAHALMARPKAAMADDERLKLCFRCMFGLPNEFTNQFSWGFLFPQSSVLFERSKSIPEEEEAARSALYTQWWRELLQQLAISHTIFAFPTRTDHQQRLVSALGETPGKLLLRNLHAQVRAAEKPTLLLLRQPNQTPSVAAEFIAPGVYLTSTFEPYRKPAAK